MKNIPEQVIDDSFEDIENIDYDIDNLYKKFISPIDKIRSIKDDSVNTDSVNFLESRIHAFYRFLGLPVVGSNKFYNPGFDPIPKNNSDRLSINNSIDKKKLEMMQLREQHFKSFSQMFNKQGVNTGIYGLCQRYIKPFNMLQDPNKFIEGREEELNDLKNKNSNISSIIEDGILSFNKQIGYSFKSAKHIIKPFNVNPFIDSNVMPIDNRICVPFLPDLNSTKISSSPDVFLLRPGIEFIIRSRLKDNVPDFNFLKNIQNIINNKNDKNIDSDFFDVVETFKNSDIINIVSDFSTTQALVVTQLIKTIKAIIIQLHKYLIDLDKIKEKITFIPISNFKGFEFGGKIKETFPITKLEKDIVTLTIKKLNANREIENEKDIGNFATDNFINLEKVNTYESQIEKLIQEKNDYANQGLENIKFIDMIVGESSGCGLIDIIAIYTALWSISIEHLIGLLDENSFNRLYNNINIRSQVITNRKNGINKTVDESLNALEEKISSILSFADLTLTRTYLSPKNNEGGYPI